MFKSLSTRLSVAVLCLVFAQVASAQTADEIVEKYLAALGGRAAFSKLKSRSAKGSIVVSSPVGDLAGTIEILNQAPNKTRNFIQLDLSGAGLGKVVQDQRFDGTAGYLIDTLQGNREVTSGEQFEAMKNASFPNPLLTYKEAGMTVELGGKEKVGEREAYVLVVKPKPAQPRASTSTRSPTFRSKWSRRSTSHRQAERSSRPRSFSTSKTSTALRSRFK